MAICLPQRRKRVCIGLIAILLVIGQSINFLGWYCFRDGIVKKKGKDDHEHNLSSTKRDLELAISALRNNSQVNRNRSLNSTTNEFIILDSSLQLPSVLHVLPQLARKSCREPALHLSAGRREASFVLGIPTVKRKRESYLYQTITSLIDGMSSAELDDTLIIIYIGEGDKQVSEEIGERITKDFGTYIQAGLIDVIAPPGCYYPDLNRYPANLGDKRLQFNWRSKQNLDFAYLMMYAAARGKYYVQLEDDVVAADGFINIMKGYINEQNPSWFVIWFSQLGFIGKCFKTSDLPFFVDFLYLFFRFKPCDWLLDHAVYCMTGCSFNVKKRICTQERNALVKHHHPPLFQHIGKFSSLPGKIQRLKEKNFKGKAMKVFISHPNPPANITTSIKTEDKHSITDAYNGQAFFWGVRPKQGEFISIRFLHPVKLKKIRITSGNYHHPTDIITNAKASILAEGEVDKIENYHVLSEFSQGSINYDFTKHNVPVSISVFRIDILQNVRHWMLISEIFFEQM